METRCLTVLRDPIHVRALTRHERGKRSGWTRPRAIDPSISRAIRDWRFSRQMMYSLSRHVGPWTGSMGL